MLSSSPALSPVRSWLVAVPRPIPAYEFAVPHDYYSAYSNHATNSSDSTHAVSRTNATSVSHTTNATDQVPLGARVLVPWRGGPVLGVVVGAGTGEYVHQLREVIAFLDPVFDPVLDSVPTPAAPWLAPATVRAVQRWAEHARVPAGLIWSDLLGASWKVDYRHWVRSVEGSQLDAFATEQVEISGQTTPPRLPDRTWALASDFLPDLLDQIREQGLLEERLELKERTQTILELVEPTPSTQSPESAKLTLKQKQAVTWLQKAGKVESMAEWSRQAGVGASVVSVALKKGYARVCEIPVAAPALPAAVPRDWAKLIDASAVSSSVSNPAPNPAPSSNKVWRLHGGRVSDRFRALFPHLREALEAGQSVLLLAPDHGTLRIAWQEVADLARHLGTKAVQWSGLLDEAQRQESHRLVQQQEARLIVGSFLALCAPVQNLALIVVLEEASDAYKLLRGSRVFVPDLVKHVAEEHSATLVYVGSVPAVEHVELEGLVLPPVRQRLHVVDYGNPPKRPEVGPLSMPYFQPQRLGYPLSHELTGLLRQVQERGRQAVLLAPRRGYSALLRCPSCQSVPQCPNCDLALRAHQEHKQLKCHQCGYQTPIPQQCESCGEALWQARGPGTEWIAAEVRRLVPALPVWRLDKDYKDDLTAMMHGETGVLVGTQLVLSQVVPPNLALIALTLADTWLSVSDFRAGERYHRLLRQLVEWHPRRAPLLVVQTFQGEHPALQALKDGHDVLHYPHSELEMRRLLSYPPFVCLARIEVSHKDMARAENAAQTLAETLFAAGATNAEILGPAAGFISRLRGEYPYQILLRARDEERLGVLLACVKKSAVRAKLRVDISPRGSIWQEEGRTWF